ncbi:hypothetical protein RHOSPDRAFT_32939 [Rhodotorula sp. JG-1b]|nr:hypothetical protein RHOSPDRAFT_32939 [Rhodotorula sp. JG-1b]
MLARFRHAYQPLLSLDWSSSPTSSPTSTWLSPQRFAAKRKPVLALVATLILAALLLATTRDPASTIGRAASSLTSGRNNIVQATVAQVEQGGFPLAPNECPQPRTTTYRLRSETLRFAPTQDWISPSPALPRSATLDDRLEAWLAAPVGTSKTWNAFNSLTCGNPSVRREQNQLHFRNNLEFWNGIDEDRVRELRQELVGVLRTEERNGRFDAVASSGPLKRGIVWTAGNADTFDRVLVSLRLLRNSYNSSLPALIFHFPSESPSEGHLAEFATLDAHVSSLTALDKAGGGRTKSFHLKGAALVEATKRFDEVLMLDSDNIPVRDPAFLFDSVEFKEMGAVFWPDYWKDQPENAIWSILGVQCRDEFTIEAGQVLLRKSDHLDAILLVEYMLQDWEFWFQLSDGDKDLFRYAFLALRKRWAVPARHLSTASWLDKNALGGDKSDRFAGHTMLQYGLASEARGNKPRPLFVHANLLKRITADLHNGNTFGRTLQLRLSQTATSATMTTDFVFHCDYLANIDPLTGIGLLHSGDTTTPPLWVREQALLSRGLETRFFDGHRGFAYVLAIENVWKDEFLFLDREAFTEELMSEVEMQRWRERVRRDQERVTQCSEEENLRETGQLVGKENDWMEVVDWADDPDLKGFEDRFYSVGGGRAGGVGFRA